MFWSLTSGVAAWTLFEVLYWWGVSNKRESPPSPSAATRSGSPLAPRHADLHLGALLLRPPPLALPPLYARVHALHHRSINIGPWSGLSMHPVESLLYASAVHTTSSSPSPPGDLPRPHLPQDDRPSFSTPGLKACWPRTPASSTRGLPSPASPPLLRVQLRHRRGALGPLVRLVPRRHGRGDRADQGTPPPDGAPGLTAPRQAGLSPPRRRPRRASCGWRAAASPPAPRPSAEAGSG